MDKDRDKTFILDIEEELPKVKLYLRQFERSFQKKHGRMPNKVEAGADRNVRNMYKLYGKIVNMLKKKNNSKQDLIKVPESIKVGTITETTEPVSNHIQAWGSNLNKSKLDQSSPSTTVSNDSVEKRINSKSHNENEKHLNEQCSKNKKFSFSLKHRQKILKERENEKRKREEEETLVNQYVLPGNVETDNSLLTTQITLVENDINLPVPTKSIETDVEPPTLTTLIENDVDLPIQTTSIECDMESSTFLTLIEKERPPSDAMSLLESMANGTTLFEDDNEPFGNEFVLDSINEFVKEKILTNDHTSRDFSADNHSLEVENSSNRKRIFSLDDDELFSLNNKRQKVILKPSSLNSQSNDQYQSSTLISELPNMLDEALVSEHSNSSFSDNENTNEKKFFKSIRKIVDLSSGYNFSIKKDLTVYDFTDQDEGESRDKNYEPPKKATKPTNTKVLKKSKLTNQNQAVKKSSTSNSKIVQRKKLNNNNSNFRKLNMKRKVAVRGYRKFNMKSFKFKKWKSYKKGNDGRCFKCGEQGHWSNACTIVSDDHVNSDVVDDGATTIEPTTIDQQIDLNPNKPLFDDLSDPELDILLDESLKEVFGFDTFRSNQKETIKRILCGKSTLLISPTGFGKSLCYQLAAYIFFKKCGYITLVVSPLISLMMDQIVNFPEKLKPVTFNSSMGEKEKQNSIDCIIRGQSQVLLLSPECLVNGFNSIPFQLLPRIAFVCIDEAHCLAEWSTNFRPSYLHLYKVLRNKLNIQNILSMTATVTCETKRIICKNLNLNITDDVIGSTHVPDNLILSVSKTRNTRNRLESVVELLRESPFKDLDSIIIYCTKREQATSLESQLRTLLQFDVPRGSVLNQVRAYHAGLSSQERTQIQKKFINGKIRIIVATIAFGMGINKADIRGVIHFNMPKSFENYVQEIGRAGRDGHLAYCHVFVDNDAEDLYMLQNFIYANGVDRPNIRRLIGKIYQPCKCDFFAESRSVCKTHQVAIPMDSLELELDIKTEIIYTTLLNLELNFDMFPIKVYPSINSTCTVVNYGDASVLEEMISHCQALNIGYALAQREQGDKFDANNFKFSIVKVASMLNQDVNLIRSQLRQLEWTTDKITGRRRKTNLSVRFGDFSYLLRSAGNLTESDIDQVTTFICDSMEKYERLETFKLQFMWCKFYEISSKQRDGDYQINLQQSTELKSFLNNYFHLPDQLPVHLDWTQLPLPSSFDIEIKIRVRDITYKIQQFISCHYEQGVNTPRRLARILSGISSPKFSAQYWSSVRQFWRSFPSCDFKQLMGLCLEGIRDSKSNLIAN
ncbi:ATP-dependent DNA helicase Q4 [Blomia tropicalis]|nr:ATP-dependent DNA helicase Q4 [Blomia tropicalis]